MEQKGLTPILIILLIAAAIGGYLVYSGKINTNKSTQQATQPSPTSECGTFAPMINPSTNKGWNIFTGKIMNYSCNPSFSIEYPSNWQQDGYTLYPFGKTDSNQDPIISLQAGGHGWYNELKISTKTFSAGTASYSWGKPQNQNYIVGFANISDGKYSFIAEVARIPLDQEQQLEKKFNQILSTFKFIQ